MTLERQVGSMADLKSDAYYEAHADFCSICGNANRLKILDALDAGQPLTVSELTEITDINQSTLSQHLKLMRNQGILIRTKDGVNNYYRIKDDRLVEGIHTIRQVVEDQMKK